MNRLELDSIPGGEIVSSGLRDLQAKHFSENALLVLVCAPRLRTLGFEIADPADVPKPREHELYGAIESRLGIEAFSSYNSLLRRMTSFARTLERNNPIK